MEISSTMRQDGLKVDWLLLKTAFYAPFLSDWRNYENWTLAGSKEPKGRATELWPKILAEFTPPPMDAAVQEELEAYVAIRKESLGQEEPMLEPGD